MSAPSSIRKELPPYTDYLELPFQAGASKGVRTYSHARLVVLAHIASDPTNG